MKNSLLSLCFLLIALVSCLDSREKELNREVLDGMSSDDKVLFKKYYSLGKKLYVAKCQNCHGNNGGGVGKLIPPLAGADFIDGHRDKISCVVRFGVSGPLTVNGKEYDYPMPANKDLRPLEIAELISYIGSSWNNDIGLVRAGEVRGSLEKCE